MHLKLQIGVWVILVWYSTSLSTHNSSIGTTGTTASHPSGRPKRASSGHNTRGGTTKGQAHTSKTTANPTDTTQSPQDISTREEDADTLINPTSFSSRFPLDYGKTSTTGYPTSISASESNVDENAYITTNPLKNSDSNPLNDEKGNLIDGDENENTTRNPKGNAVNTPLDDDKGKTTDGDENENSRNPIGNAVNTLLNEDKGNTTDGDENENTRNPIGNAVNTLLNEDKGNTTDGDKNEDTTTNPIQNAAYTPLNNDKGNTTGEDENEDTTINPIQNAANSPLHDENRNLTENVASVSSGMSDAGDWMNLLSTLSNLCPGIDVCGQNESLKGNTTVRKNVCCIECSCKNSCFKSHNCCFDNKDVEDTSSIFDCLIPVEGAYDTDRYGELTSYRFVTAPPKNGCVTNLESSEKNFAPWGDFYPVYSKSLNLNFKNEYLAKCHGAQDFQEWPIVVTYGDRDFKGAGALTAFYRTFQLNKTNTFLVFDPPNDNSRSSDHVCYHVTSSCPKNREDTFNIPSYVGMDRHSIIQACNTGPKLLYFHMPSFAFKNVFCALCNGFNTVETDSLPCFYRYASDIKTSIPTFKSFLIGKNTEARVRGNEQAVVCYGQTQSQNDLEQCTKLQCPMLQVRTTNGRCLNPAPVMHIDCLYISLNLTTTQAIGESFLKRIFQRKLQLMSPFRAASPWEQSHWEIVKIAIRMESNNTEFRLVQRFRRKQIDFHVFIQYVQNKLRKKWTVQFDKELQFDQNFAVHGNLVLDLKFDDSFLIPEWTLFRSFSTPVQPPVWLLLYTTSNVYRTYGMHVNKLFLCEQVQLKNSEFVVQSQESALYLNRSQRFLYPDEFSLLGDQSGHQTVHICLKDSDYIKMASVGALAYMYPGAMFLVGWLTAEVLAQCLLP